MIRSIRQAPLRLFLAVAVAVVGLMTVTDLPSASPVHAQEQAVTATRNATGESPPARPTDLQASAEPDSVSLTWTASTDQTVTHYAVLRRDRDKADAGVFKVIDSNAGSATSYTDRSVSPEDSYVYRVKAVSPTGVSQWSSYARADIPADPEALAPSGLSAKFVSGDDGVIEGVALAWDAPAEDAASVTGYEILRAVGDGDLATLVADTGSAGTTYADDTATKAGESYAYRVKALRGEEASQPSDRAVAIIPKVTAVEAEPLIAKEQNAETKVSADWGLIPSGLGAGDRFRLLFRTTATRDATSTDIADYDAFVQAAAAAGHADIQSHNAAFKVLGSTADVDARDNTATTYTADDKGVAVYWLNGDKVADDYEDFYDGSWSNADGGKDEDGVARTSPQVGTTAGTYTGSTTDGREATILGTSRALGTSNVRVGDPLGGDSNVGSAATGPFYGLSGVFVVGEDVEVPETWSLIPSGLGAGDRFRLIFLSSTARHGAATHIADYNGFVQTRAANGHADIRRSSSLFRVVGSTAAVDARDNTSTTYTADDKGVPIYWLGGNKVAGDYEEFYDGEWDDEANAKDESGNNRSTSGDADYPFTGSEHNGTEDSFQGSSRALGAPVVRVGRPNDAGSNNGPLSSSTNSAFTETRPLYGLSAVFRVTKTTVPADWSLIPSGLGAGDRFRLLFIGTTTRNASSSDIDVYNTFVQDLVAMSGHADIKAFSATFRMLGSTETVDARDNTGTTGTGVPIYWLGGAQVADDYADFYDGGWDEEATGARESGDSVTIGNTWKIWTGSAHDGTEAMSTINNVTTSRALGNAGNQWVMQGSPNGSDSDHGPIESDTAGRNTTNGVYGLSGVFVVSAAPITGDFDLHDDNGDPRGVWGNDDTIWVSNSPLGETEGDKIVAYDRSTGSRDGDKDFNTLNAAGNNAPARIWSDGETMFVLDSDDAKVYAYKMSDKSHDESKDITVAADNGSPRGIWGNHETIWVSDTSDDKLYAYKRVEDEYGTRDYARDFNTLRATGNTSARGIWSDGLDMFVADTTSGARKVYSYSMFDMAHRPARGFNLDDENGGPAGIWGDVGTLWVVDVDDDKLYAYGLPPTPEVSVAASPRRVAGGGLVTLTGMVSDPDAGSLTYAWSSSGDLGTFAGASAPSATWTAPDATGEDQTVTLTLTVTGVGGATRTATADVVVSAPITGDFDLHDGNADPGGIWGNADTIWVSNSPLGTSDGDKIFAYDRSTRVRDEGKDFNTLNAAGNNSPSRIWSDGETMFVLDSIDDDRVYAYNMDDKARDDSKDIALAADNGNPRGIWGNGETIWVSDDNDDKLFAYKRVEDPDTPDNEYGMRDTDRDFNTLSAAGNTLAKGIWSDGTDMFVANTTATQLELRVFAYSMSDMSHRPARSFNLDDENRSPAGVWGDDGTLWVVDVADAKLYAYDPPSPPTVSVEAFPLHVVSGDSLTLTGTAAEPEGHTLTYAWTSNGGGTFADTTALSTTWTAPDATVANQAVTLTLTVTDTEGETGTATVDVLVSPPAPIIDDDFGLHEDNAAPGGIWGNDDTIWVSNTFDDKIYAYARSTGLRDEDKDFDTLADAGNTMLPRASGPTGEPCSSWTHSTKRSTPTTWTTRPATTARTSPWRRVMGVPKASGATTGPSGCRTMSGTSCSRTSASMTRAPPTDEYGTRDADSDFNTLDAGNAFSRGIWSDGIDMFVADITLAAEKVFSYSMSDMAYGSARSFDLEEGNDHPAGIWSDGATLWVVDQGDDKLYAYGLPAADAVSDDATLSALSLSSVTLSPSFAADTLTYTGNVGNDVASTTVTATATHDGATVAIVPADADDAADGHQVALDVGDTTVSVTVTAEDGTTTQTYAVTVTRAEAIEVKSITMERDDGREGEPYRIGDELIFVVEFSHPVRCHSTEVRAVQFFFGMSQRAALHYLGDGTTQYRFRYIVEEGDLDTDGITIHADALVGTYAKDACLTGGVFPDTLFDKSGIAAQGPLADHKVDGVRPVLESAEFSEDGLQIRLTFSEPLSTTTAGVSDFEVTVAGATRAVDSVAVVDATVTLTLVSAVADPGTVIVTYTDPTTNDDDAAVQDAAGNDAATFTQTFGNTVLADWSLVPQGLGAGDRFRLIFISEGTRNGSSTDIAVYNTFIQDAAAAGHADIQQYSSGFRVVGSTADVDARDNTATTYTDDDKGVPIYWLDGNKVADDYENFYDGGWDDETNPKDESGSDRSTSRSFTGSNHDGTEAFTSGNSRAFGADSVRIGELSSPSAGWGPLSSGTTAGQNTSLPLYGLSGVFQVAGQAVTSDDATLSELSLGGVTLSPSFAAETLTYTGSVDNAVTSTTVTATANDDGATVAIVPADADDTADGHQVALGDTTISVTVGDTAISVTVTAEDGTTTQTYAVTVTRAEELAVTVTADPSTVNGGGTVQLRRPGRPRTPPGRTSSTVTGTVGDVTYAWTSSGGGTFTNASAANTRWTAPAAATADQTVTLTLTVTDTVGETAFSTDVTVRENQPPTVVLGGIATEIGGGVTLSLFVSTATDPEGDTLTYAWTSDGGGSFDDAGALETFWTAPDATDADQTVMLTLTVTDDGAGARSASVTVVVTVKAQSQLAVMVTADPTTVNGGGTVQLGTTVTGPVGTVYYNWESSFGTFSSTTAPNPVWTAPPARASDLAYTLALEVRDSAGSAFADVRITVRGNQAPEVSLETTPTHVDGGDEVSLTAAVTDPEGDGLTYAWTSSAGGSFDDAGALDTTWTAPPAARQDQPVTLTLTVTDDGAGTRSTTQTLSLTVRANEAPAGSVSAQPETVLGGKDVQLTSSVADPENDPLTYAWTSSGGGAFADASAANTRWTAPAAATADQTVTLTLTVTDTVGDTAFSTDVTVRENQPPTVVLGSIPTEVGGGVSLFLVVATATDPEGDTLTYAWTSDGGGSFGDAGAPDTFWVSPEATDADQTVMLTLTATDDGAGARSTSVTAVVTVRAQSQLAVTITADPTTVNGGGTVMLSSTVTGDSGTVFYSWSTIGFGTLSSTSIHNPVWTASPASSSDIGGRIDLEVRDSTGSAFANVLITVRGNQAPEVSATADPASVAGGGAVTLDGTATDPEGDTLTYAWTSDGGGSFADAGALDTTWTAPDATDAAQTVILTLMATDDGAGARSASDTVTVTVEALDNTAPAFTTGAEFSTNENQAATFQVTAEDADAGDAVTYAITGGADLALFNIVATSGLLGFPVTLDHEDPADADSNNTYLVTVTATGGTGARALTTDQAITVTVTDVDEPPSAPATPTVSAVSDSSDSLSVTWTAPDNSGKPDIDSYDLQYRKGTTGNFTNGPQDVTGLTDTITALDADSLYQVQVRATNDEGDSAWSSAGSGTTGAQANAAPFFPADTTTRDVPENSPAGTNVGDPVTAMDDDGDTLTYTLEGTDAASFDIDSESGQIQTKSGVTYDYETKEGYSVTVKADDGRGGIDTVAVTINLLDVPETPAITLAFEVAGLQFEVVKRDEDAGTVAIGLRAETEGNTPPAEDFEVILRTVDQTAEAPGDYVAATLTYTFRAAGFVLENGQYVQTVSHDIEIVDDEIVEKVEYFELDVDQNALPGHVTAPSITTVVIEIQEDDRTTVRVENVTVDEGDDAVLTLTIDREVSFDFWFLVIEIKLGDEPDLDLFPAPAVQFLAGQTRQTLTVRTVEDVVVEPNETVELELVRNALVELIELDEDPRPTVTILNDDVPEWTLRVDPATIAEAGGSSTLTVRTGEVTFADAQTIELDFAGGSATLGTDFTVADADGNPLTAPYALTLAVGESAVTATITAVEDTDDDDGEQIQVSATRNGETLGATQTLTITTGAPSGGGGGDQLPGAAVPLIEVDDNGDGVVDADPVVTLALRDTVSYRVRPGRCEGYKTLVVQRMSGASEGAPPHIPVEASQEVSPMPCMGEDDPGEWQTVTLAVPVDLRLDLLLVTPFEASVEHSVYYRRTLNGPSSPLLLWGHLVTARVRASETLAPVGSLTVAPEARDYPRVTWSAVPGATDYQVQWRWGPDEKYGRVHSQEGSIYKREKRTEETAYTIPISETVPTTDEGVERSQRITVRVRPYDSEGLAVGPWREASLAERTEVRRVLAGFSLLDADGSSQGLLAALTDGATVELAYPDGGSYAIRAELVEGELAGSVHLELTGKKRAEATDDEAPYLLAGGEGMALPAGSYKLKAKAYGGPNRTYAVQDTLEVSFTVRAAASAEPGSGELNVEEEEEEDTEPLTARFEGLPEAGHGGAGKPFAFRLVFSEAVSTTPEALRDHALKVTNATVEAASRVDDRSDLWEVRLTPESDAMVTVSLSPPAACDAAGAVCTEDGRMLSVGVARVILGPPPNSPATGQPTISGTAQVGQTLTADTSGIADEDGLTTVSYSYQWMADDTNIQGATGSSYTLTEDDKGKAIKVIVSFTDDANNEESLPSAATDAVTALPGKPQSLAGKATAQEIQLTWKAPTGSAVVEYVVYRGILQNGSMNGQALSKYATIDAAGKAMTYTDDNVEEGVEYRYRVVAVNSSGEGKKSNWLDITAE